MNSLPMKNEIIIHMVQSRFVAMLSLVSKRVAATAGRRYLSKAAAVQLAAPMITDVGNSINSTTTLQRSIYERGNESDGKIDIPSSNGGNFILDTIDDFDFYECRPRMPGQGSVTHNTTRHGHNTEWKKWRRAKMKGGGYGQKWPKKR